MCMWAGLNTWMKELMNEWMKAVNDLSSAVLSFPGRSSLYIYLKKNLKTQPSLFFFNLLLLFISFLWWDQNATLYISPKCPRQQPDVQLRQFYLSYDPKAKRERKSGTSEEKGEEIQMTVQTCCMVHLFIPIMLILPVRLALWSLWAMESIIDS